MAPASTRTLSTYSPPANLSDLTDDNKQLWSEHNISHWIQSEINAIDPNTGKALEGPDNIPRTPLSQFFNGTVTAYDVDQAATSNDWIAFPNLVNKLYTAKEPLRWQIADASRMFQDEYLEWSVERDDSGNLVIATFTCEGPEYWQFLATYQPKTLWELYQKMNPDYVGQMQETDLYLINPVTKAAVYDPRNIWNFTTNSGTIAHLIQPNNTLSAEVDIGAQATVIRKDPQGKIVTNTAALIQCSRYGNSQRNSDPTIGAGINGLARGGSKVSLADPVGLYIHDVDFSGFQLDMSGNQDQSRLINVPDNWYNWQRGDIKKNMGLRLQIKPPVGAKADNGNLLTLGDIYDNGKSTYVQYAAQFTDYIRMSVSGVVLDGTAAAPQPCPQASSAAVEDVRELKVSEHGTKKEVRFHKHLGRR